VLFYVRTPRFFFRPPLYPGGDSSVRPQPRTSSPAHFPTLFPCSYLSLPEYMLGPFLLISYLFRSDDQPFKAYRMVMLPCPKVPSQSTAFPPPGFCGNVHGFFSELGRFMAFSVHTQPRSLAVFLTRTILCPPVSRVDDCRASICDCYRLSSTCHLCVQPCDGVIFLGPVSPLPFLFPPFRQSLFRCDDFHSSRCFHGFSGDLYLSIIEEEVCLTFPTCRLLSVQPV